MVTVAGGLSCFGLVGNTGADKAGERSFAFGSAHRLCWGNHRHAVQKGFAIVLGFAIEILVLLSIEYFLSLVQIYGDLLQTKATSAA